MKTIKERAREAYHIDRDNVFAELKRNAYIDGATEQKAIDIDKACEWLNENARHLLSAEMRRKFRKAMEE